jgi:hypothetical protein
MSPLNECDESATDTMKNHTNKRMKKYSAHVVSYGCEMQ